MANRELIEIIEEGVEGWNTWRRRNPQIRLDFTEAYLNETNLRGADLREAKLRGADLSEADLSGADLRRADLKEAHLSSAHLLGTNLREADLHRADLREARLFETYLLGADLSGADLCLADLRRANLTEANFFDANFDRVELLETLLTNVDLSMVKNLETCRHRGPSIIDHRTIAKSGRLPLSFLRGCGLPNIFIDNIPALFLNNPIEFYSCFISYSSKDQDFAERLHADLQNKGVRCWFAPEDMKIGDKLRPTIDQSIRLHEKLLLILSETSVTSQWVEQEVETALERERKENRPVLFPVRIDDTVMEVTDGWPSLIRNTRHIGDFRNWKDHDPYKKAFDRLLRDLKTPGPTKEKK